MGKVTVVTNVWTIYQPEEEDGQGFAELSRPQDWGNPKWMYRVYRLMAPHVGYINEVHCWTDKQMGEADHLQLFAPLVAQILFPGTPVGLCGNRYLKEDDFWQDAWGQQPPPFIRDADSDNEQIAAHAPASEAEDLRRVGAALGDRTPLELTTDIANAWMIVSLAQLAVRHPALGSSKVKIIEVARLFQDTIALVHPELATLMERGWDETQDA